MISKFVTDCQQWPVVRRSQEEPPIDASTLVLFRKRLKMDVIMEANEYMLEAFKEKESNDKNDDDHTNPPSGGGQYISYMNNSSTCIKTKSIV